ncbi:MAG: hypothetical protein K2X66_13505 [Cyanobacteria bacterium]|nr:hypothetical protein [Cyanobacteriota bacterium]
MKFEKILHQAFDSAAEVIVCTKYMQDGVQGRVQDITDETFSVFHTCPKCATLWVLALEDVVSVGMIVAPPKGERHLHVLESLLPLEDCLIDEVLDESLGNSTICIENRPDAPNDSSGENSDDELFSQDTLQETVYDEREGGE